MRSFNIKYKIPILERFKKQKITSLHSEYFENIKQLLKFCSNLQELYFSMDCYQQLQGSIRKFLIPVLAI
jgi:hypothetical protein